MVGNLISQNSVLANIAKIEGARVSRVNVRNEKGAPSWPEFWTEERIQERERMGYRAFQKEYMNNPIVEGQVFTEMNWSKPPALSKFPFLVLYGDPSPSNNKQAQNSMKAMFLLGVHEGKFYVLDGRLERATNSEFVQWYYDLARQVPEGVQLYSLIENNTLQNPFYEQVILPLVADMAKAGKHVNLVPDDRKKPEKFSRIEGNLEPLHSQGRLMLNSDKKENPHFKRLEEQFLMLAPQMRAPADGPDAVEGGVWWIQRKTETIAAGSMRVLGGRFNSKRY